MTTVIDANATVIDNQPVLPIQPGGSLLMSQYNVIDLRTIDPNETVGTYQMVFLTASRQGPEAIADLIASLNGRLEANGEYIVSYMAFEETLLDVTIPSQICVLGSCLPVPTICLPGTDLCFGAGSTLVTCYRYTLWYLTRLGAPPAPLLAGGRALAWIILATGLVAIALSFAIVAIILLIQGRITWKDLTGYLTNLTPGEQVRRAEMPIVLAIIGFGVTVVATSILVPMIATKAGVTVPIGPARIETSVEAPPAPRGRRR